MNREQESTYQREVAVLMSQLKEPTRTVLEKCYLEHKKYAEVAEEMHLSHDMVKRHISKALILSGEYSIQEISDKLHFTSPSFFGRYFKEHVGCAPGKYASLKSGTDFCHATD